MALDHLRLNKVLVGIIKLTRRIDALERRARIRFDAWDESKHPRAEDGKFSAGAGAISTNDWETWAVSGFDVNEAMRGSLRPGQRDAEGRKLTDEDVAGLKRIGESIQAAAEASRIPGGKPVFRGVAFETEEDMHVAFGGRSLELPELTSTATDPSVASAYAEHRSETFGQPVRAVIEFMSGNGMPGVMTDPLGAGGSDEYVLPKGAKFTTVKYAGKNSQGEHIFRAYMSGSKAPKGKR